MEPSENLQKSMFNAVLMLIGLSVWIVAVTLIRFIFIDKMSSMFTLPILSYIAISVGFLFLINGLILFMYFVLKLNMRSQKEQTATFFVIAFTYTLCIYGSIVNVYIMPMFLNALILAQLGQKNQAMLANFVNSAFITYALMIVSLVTGQSLLPVIVMMVTGLLCGGVAALVLSRDASRLAFTIKSFFICVCAIFIMRVMSFITLESDLISMDTVYMGISAIVQFSLALVISPIIERIFNLVTNVRLMELTSHTSPLINRLLKEAPGTFNHSLAVASFAQMCATSIGENPFLAMACAYYHDVGKLANPLYFKENQSDYNPHDDILPEVSAEILRSHTDYGFALCEEYHIPEEISHVTVQHHGTMLIPVFYHKAKKLTDGTVDQDEYCYHGITPRTKLAALIMICDSSEAAIRAMDQPDGDKVDKLLRKLISDRLESGQFDNCEITMRELNAIRETIINAYGGLFHKRLQYPEGK
ncbi:MAG: HDIG domain-containing protein [Clostridia bacterium]|nr:HDIG domain-containing protein [Clostridia bacterium]